MESRWLILCIGRIGFASNSRLRRFYSGYYEQGYQIDKILWCSPTISELVYVAYEIKSRKCEAVVIFPDWKTSSYYNHFVQGNQSLQ